jgi:hypothetical protein
MSLYDCEASIQNYRGHASQVAFIRQCLGWPSNMMLEPISTRQHHKEFVVHIFRTIQPATLVTPP